MKRPSLRTILIVLPLVIVNAGAWLFVRSGIETSARQTIRIDAVYPSDDADFADSFAVLFSRPIGGEAGSPADGLFTISPPLAGKFRWAAPGRLEFAPAADLSPGHQWRLAPTPDFAALAGFTLETDREVLFRTRAVALTDVRLARTTPESADVLFRFSLPVRPSELIRRLTVACDGETVRAEAASEWPGNELLVRFPRKAGARECRITVDGFLTSEGGDRPMGSPAEKQLDFGKGLALEGTGFGGFRRAPPDPDDCTVELWFNRPLDRRLAPPAVSVRPEVKDLVVRFSDWDCELLLEGEFVPGTLYVIRVPAGLSSRDGEVLETEAVSEYAVPDRPPSVRIPFARGVLSPKGHRLLEVYAANAPVLAVKATRIHENNLCAHLLGLRADLTGREVLRREYEVPGTANRLQAAALDLGALLGDARGLFQVEVEAPGAWAEDSAVVALTDLAITVKRGRLGLAAWVTGLSTGAPVEGARVAVLSRTNQPLAEGTTGPDGLARLEVPGNHPDGDAWLVLAEKDGDRAFLALDSEPRLCDGTDQSGRFVPETWDVMLYADRGAYRPGETVHLTGIVRRPDGSPAPEFPLAVEVRRPDGAVASVLTAAPGAQGFFHADFATPAAAQTGQWRLRALLPGAKTSLAEEPVLVEEFVPARIEITALVKDTLVLPGEAAAAEVTARYLFGLPAANLPLAMTYRHVPAEFRSAAFPEHRFTVVADPPRGPSALPPATLDATGRAEVVVPPPETAGRFDLAVSATVTEPGSRSVSKEFGSIVDTARRHVGLLPPAGGVAPVGHEFEISFVQRTPEDGAAPPVAFRYTLSRVVRDVEYLYEDGRIVWRDRERIEPVAAGDAVAAAEGNLRVRCDRRGSYRLEALDAETGLTTRIEFLAAATAGEALLAAVSRADRLEIACEPASVKPGEAFRARVKSPFAGRLLLTVECEEVLATKVVEMAGNEAEVELTLPAEARGAAYVSASVVRALDPAATDFLPHRAAGLARVAVAHDAARLPIALAVPEKSEPGAEVLVTVEVPRTPGEAAPVVHLFAVDEGVLSVTAYRTPDPFAHFFGPRALSVATRDGYADLLPDRALPAGTARIGGDAPEELEALRRSPVPVTVREPAVVFLAARPVGDDGKLAVSLRMPDLRGALRVMAVAAAGDRYASTDRRIVLESPVMAEVGWPRFLAPGDRCRVPVKVFNRTGGAIAVALSAAASGPVDAAFAAAEPLAVAADGDATAWLSVAASSEGEATVTLTLARADAAPLTVTGAFPVRPAGPLHAETTLYRIPAGEEVSVPPAKGFAPGARRRLQVSAEPSIELRPAIESLLGYPYGCVEQTTSRCLAILAAPALLTDAGRAEAARDMIRVGIDRLAAMQTPDGGLAYWAGGVRADRFGTGYAAGFLAAAARAGHDVPAYLKDGIAKYLKRELDRVGPGAPDGNERALFCRVLAAFGRPPEGWMEKLAEAIGDLDTAGRAALAGAFLEAGRRDRALAVLTEDTLGLTVPASFSGRLSSQVSGEASLLSTLLDLDPAHAWVPVLAKRLDDARTLGGWRTTFDNAAVIGALAKYQALRGPAPGTPADFTVSAQCGEETATVSPDAPEKVALPGNEAPVALRCRGQGVAYAAVETVGLLDTGAVKAGDAGIVARRKWTDPAGRPLDGVSLKVGDLVRVEVTLALKGGDEGASVGNVAIVDALPGGLEPENPRLETSAARSAIEWDRIREALPANGEAVAVRPPGGPARLDTPDRAEFLHDRVVLFATASGEAKTFVYCLRAVTAGTFTVPALEASCMYEPSISSLSGGGKLEVR